MRGRDEREFKEYVEARLTGMRRSAYLLCGDPYAADDIVSTMLAKLFRHWGRVSTVANRDSYVRRMLVTTFLDEKRRSWNNERPTEILPEPTPIPAIDVVDRLSLVEALSQLPPKCRAVLVLRFFEDLSVEQTAEALGCAAGTVKAHTHHGLTALRTIFAQPILATLTQEDQ